jgi:hypothetical protein
VRSCWKLEVLLCTNAGNTGGEGAILLTVH